MTREELAQQLKDVADMLEKPSSFIGPEGPDVGAFVGAVLGSTDTYTTREAVGEFVSQIEKHGGKQALENCLRDSGWVKAGEDGAGIEQIADSINEMNPIEAVNACKDMLNVLINKHMKVNNAFFNALAENSIYDESTEQFDDAAKEWAEEHDYIEKESDSFDDAAKEWAEENGWKHPDHDSISDFAEDVDNGEVRDFVVEYIQDNL